MSVESRLSGRSRLTKLTGVQVMASGSFLPDNVVTNEDLNRAGIEGFDPDWILQRTGIRERRHAPPDMCTSDMAFEAARNAIEKCDVDPADIDLLILATLSPDYLLPATACTVQHRLGLCCPAVDLSAACAGFLYAMVTGMQFVATGCSRLALVIGADTNSRVMDPKDRGTFPLFGDGAGAVLLGPGGDKQGMLAYTLGADGSGMELLWRPGGGSKIDAAPEGDGEAVSPSSCYVQMEGRPVFKWAIRLLEDTVGDVLTEAGLARDDIDLWVFHQANLRIIEAAADNLGLDRDKVVIHLDRYGNTSAGSVPIAIDEALREGRIRPGSNVVMSGFGAGLSWGTCVFRW